MLFKNASVYKNTLNILNIKYWELGVKSKFLVFLKVLTLSRIIKEFQPNIVQAWMYNACFFAVLCKIFKIYKIPLIWCIRCSDMTTKYYTLSLKFLIVGCKFLSGKVDKIVYNSFSGMKHHIDLGYSSKNKIVIVNGVNATKFKKSDSFRKILRDKYSLNINLVLSGDKFSSSKDIFSLIDKYKINNQVKYLGKVSFKNLVALYNQAKFLVTATLYESSSLPVLEAVATKTPIIASNTLPNIEMTKNLSINLFQANDPLSLAKAINNIWNNDLLIKQQTLL